MLNVTTLNTDFDLKAVFHPKIQKLRLNAKVNIKTFPAESMFLIASCQVLPTPMIYVCLRKEKKKEQHAYLNIACLVVVVVGLDKNV